VPFRISITFSFDARLTERLRQRLMFKTAFVLTIERSPNWFHSGNVSAPHVSHTKNDEKLAIHPAARKKFSRAESERVAASASGSIASALTTLGFSTVR
jgi:hypothetical protein